MSTIDVAKVLRRVRERSDDPIEIQLLDRVTDGIGRTEAEANFAQHERSASSKRRAGTASSSSSLAAAPPLRKEPSAGGTRPLPGSDKSASDVSVSRERWSPQNGGERVPIVRVEDEPQAARRCRAPRASRRGLGRRPRTGCRAARARIPAGAMLHVDAREWPRHERSRPRRSSAHRFLDGAGRDRAPRAWDPTRCG